MLRQPNALRKLTAAIEVPLVAELDVATQRRPMYHILLEMPAPASAEYPVDVGKRGRAVSSWRISPACGAGWLKVGACICR